MRDLPRQEATSVGSFAADIVAAGGEADVIATFERAFYLLCQRGIIAVCLTDLGNGPINVLVPPRLGAAPWHDVVRVGMKAAVTSTGIVVHGGFALGLERAAPWQPPAWLPFHATHARASCAEVTALWRALPPTRRDKRASLATGLAPLLLEAPATVAANATAVAARAQIATLQSALPQALRDGVWSDAAVRAATLLIGLGAGLTPSGDDLLGGLLLALTARGAPALRDALFDRLVDELNDLTVPVSAMHLTAAAHGQGHAIVHDLINAMLAHDAAVLPARLDAVAAIGATSGWDAIAGIIIGLAG